MYKNKFEEFFYGQPKKHLIHKWKHYFDIYEKHFSNLLVKIPLFWKLVFQKEVV